MTLGEKLYELRKDKRLTQDEVAEKLDVTRQTVSKWETDQSQPDFDKIKPMCELYGVTPDVLLGFKEKSEHNDDEENKWDWDEAKKHMFKKGKDDEDDEDEWANTAKNRAEIVNSIVWMIAIAAYFIVSFQTKAWNVTWVIFLIAVAVSSFVKLICIVTDKSNKEDK